MIGGSKDLHLKINPTHVYEYDDGVWLLPEEERTKILDLANQSARLPAKLSRKTSTLGGGLSRSVIFTEDNTPIALYQGKSQALGSGYFGSVKIGQNIRTGEFVAVKIINLQPKDSSASEKTASKKRRKSFKTEKAILQRYKSGKSYRGAAERRRKRKVYLVEELINGRELNEVFSSLKTETPRDEQEYAFVVASIALATLKSIESYHTNKPPIIHRDIKPSNMLLTPNGEVSVIDPGLAVQLGHELITPPLMDNGDRAYMPGDMAYRYEGMKGHCYSIREDWHAFMICMNELGILHKLEAMSYENLADDESRAFRDALAKLNYLEQGDPFKPHLDESFNVYASSLSASTSHSGSSSTITDSEGSDASDKPVHVHYADATSKIDESSEEQANVAYSEPITSSEADETSEHADEEKAVFAASLEDSKVEPVASAAIDDAKPYDPHPDASAATVSKLSPEEQLYRIKSTSEYAELVIIIEQTESSVDTLKNGLENMQKKLQMSLGLSEDDAAKLINKSLTQMRASQKSNHRRPGV